MRTSSPIRRYAVVPGLVALTLAVGGCAATAGTAPQDPSAARQHSSDGAGNKPAENGPAKNDPAKNDRATLLRTCPARAATWFRDMPEAAPGLPRAIVARLHHGLRADEDYVRQLHARYDALPESSKRSEAWSQSFGFLMTAEEERSVWARQERVEPALEIARGYLEKLPADQAGSLRNDSDNGAVVVQVTRDAERVRAELQRRVGDGVTVRVETVRYSQAEIGRIADRIQALKGIPFSSLGRGGGNGRVDVTVTGDVEKAREALAKVADPCSFTVEFAEVFPLDAPASTSSR